MKRLVEILADRRRAAAAITLKQLDKVEDKNAPQYIFVPSDMKNPYAEFEYECEDF